jgi:hypothetical protein
MFARLTESTYQAQNKPFGRHFQGGSCAARYPGLKPWAIICSRFAANPTASGAMICSRFLLRPISPCRYIGQVAAKSDSLRGCSVRPFHVIGRDGTTAISIPTQNPE